MYPRSGVQGRYQVAVTPGRRRAPPLACNTRVREEERPGISASGVIKAGIWCGDIREEEDVAA